MHRPIIVGLALVMAASLPAPAGAQEPPASLPKALAGSYQGAPGRAGMRQMHTLELDDIVLEGQSVTGVVATYRSPSGNCVSERTPFSGTFKDGVLRLRSQPMKSQRADDRPCGRIAVEVTFEKERASGTLGVGGQSLALELAPR